MISSQQPRRVSNMHLMCTVLPVFVGPYRTVVLSRKREGANTSWGTWCPFSVVITPGAASRVKGFDGLGMRACMLLIADTARFLIDRRSYRLSLISSVAH